MVELYYILHFAAFVGDNINVPFVSGDLEISKATYFIAKSSREDCCYIIHERHNHNVIKFLNV